MRFKSLDEIFADDLDGLLDSKGSSYTVKTEDERLVSSFHEINEFLVENGRAPEANMSNMKEYQLHKRLIGFKESPEKIAILAAHDNHNLLIPEKKIESLDDIFDDDEFDLLDSTGADIFTLRNIPDTIEQPDYVARRKKCRDFNRFEQMFIDCQRDMKSGRRKLAAFKNEQEITAGKFYILRGVLGYVEKVGERTIKNGKKNARLRMIFENGTESDMLLRSLSCELYKDGRRVLDNEEELLKFQDIDKDDVPTGYIYVLKSLSNDADIASIPDLYKIGYTEQAVQERIKNAEKQATYLMAPVQVISTFKCYNLKTTKLESLIHNFFGSACLNITVIDSDGKQCHPREWFTVPLDVIEEAIMMILDGSVIKFRYDLNEKIIKSK